MYGRRGATGLLDLLFSTLNRRSVAPDQCLDFCTAPVLSDEVECWEAGVVVGVLLFSRFYLLHYHITQSLSRHQAHCIGDRIRWRHKPYLLGTEIPVLG